MALFESIWRELLQAVLPGLIAFSGAMLGVELRAKTSERGRILARNHDLQLILAEIRAQKEVEANVSGGEWQRQWRLQKKIESYSLLLEKLEVLKEMNKKLKSARSTLMQDGEMEEVRSAMEQSLIDFQHARSSARLVASGTCLAAVQHVVIPIREKLNVEADVNMCYESVRTIVRDARVEFTRLARIDLGFEFSPESPDGA